MPAVPLPRSSDIYKKIDDKHGLKSRDPCLSSRDRGRRHEIEELPTKSVVFVLR